MLVQSSGPSRTSDVLAQIVDIPVMLPSPAEVRDYMALHPDIGGLIAPLCAAARSKLQGDVQLSLELYRDHEGDDSYLTLYARQKHYSPDLLGRIDAVNEAIGDMLRDCSGWVQLSTDFRSAR